MCIYKKRTHHSVYRKIYEQHYGPIPKDEDGRTYEIHHIDGDSTNNDPSNLVALTLQEHYDLHYNQGDYQACRLMALQRMNKTPEEISELSRLSSKKQLEDGTHISQIPGGMDKAWQATRARVSNGSHIFLDSEFHKKNNAKRIEDGTHHFLNSDFQKEVARRSIENGTNKFADPEWQKQKAKKSIENGTHSFSQLVTCPHCMKIGGLGPMKRWHFDNCNSKS